MLYFMTIMTTMCAFFDFMKTSPMDDALEKKFRDRSPNEWEDMWHSEKHSRCREQLTRHMYWACEKDIYRLFRRSADDDLQDLQETERFETNLRFPWLRATHARRLVRWRRGGSRRKRSSGRGITAECCAPPRDGCTWEEYAEYCPFKRKLHRSAEVLIRN